jgi:hypothetical protein
LNNEEFNSIVEIRMAVHAVKIRVALVAIENELLA